MTHSRTLLRRSSVAIATAGLLTSGMVGLASSASAKVTGQLEGGTLVWGLSTYLNTTTMGSLGPLATGYVAPATFDAVKKLSTFTVQSADIESDGSAEIALDGASLNYAPTGNRWLKFDDLVIDVDADGNGELSALVSYGPGVGAYPNSSYDPAVAAYRGPTRVNLVDLVGNTAAENTRNAAGYTLPALNGTWSPNLITFLAGDAGADPAVPALSYRSQLVNDDPTKAPQPLAVRIDVAAPKVSHQTTAASVAGGLNLAVTGTGFRAVTNPGDAGVYVGLAPSGGLPSVSTQAGMAAFAAADYVVPARIVDGAFTGSLHADTAALDPKKSYSIYTWQAHSHSNTSQDTETPVTIDWSKLTVTPEPPATPAKAVATATAKVTKKPTTAKAGALAVTLKSSAGKPAGKVTVKLTSKGKKAVTKTANAKNGKVVVKLPKLKAGSWKATVVYAGSDDFTSAKKVVTFKVKKAKKAKKK